MQRRYVIIVVFKQNHEKTSLLALNKSIKGKNNVYIVFIAIWKYTFKKILILCLDIFLHFNIIFLVFFEFFCCYFFNIFFF